MVTRLLAALLALALFAAPAAANDPANLRSHVPDYRAIASAAGLPDTVDVNMVDTTDGTLNGGFWRGGWLCEGPFCMDVPPFVVVLAPADWPVEYKLAVLLHEVGHYHQLQDGFLDGHLHWPTAEWDADAFAVQELCRLGLSGPEVMAEALTVIWERRGSARTSATHGSLVLRIRYVASLSCGSVGSSAP